MKARIYPVLRCECGQALSRIPPTLRCDNPDCQYYGRLFEEPVFELTEHPYSVNSQGTSASE